MDPSEDDELRKKAADVRRASCRCRAHLGGAVSRIGMWPLAGCVSAAWTVYAHLDKSTINYGLSRPGFWVDALAWYTLLLVAIRMSARVVYSSITACATKRRMRRVRLVFGVVVCQLCFIAHRSLGDIMTVPCWVHMLGRGPDFGSLVALRESISPFLIAHYTWTRDEYIQRRANHFWRYSNKNATHFDREQADRNVCKNEAVHNLHRELRRMVPTPSTMVETDGVSLVAALFTNVKKEGPNLDLWIDHHLRLGFDYVHLVFDSYESHADFNQSAAARAQWGDRIRVSKPVPNCGQGCAKRTVVRTYKDVVGWLAWMDTDEFLYPLRWNGPLTLRRTLSGLRELGYCEVQMAWLSFGDSGHPSRPSSPLDAHIRTEVPRWPGYGKSIGWMPALVPSDGFNHEYRISDRVHFCKSLKRGSITIYSTPPGVSQWNGTGKLRLKKR